MTWKSPLPLNAIAAFSALASCWIRILPFDAASLATINNDAA